MISNRIFASNTPYVAWAALSSVVLTVACLLDPYVFAFAAYGAATVSGIVVIVALLCGLRRLMWALLSTAPTAVAFAVLSTYRWS